MTVHRALAFAVLALAACRNRPETVTFEQRGLRFEHVKSWIVSDAPAPPPPRFIRETTGRPPKAGGYRVALTSPDDAAIRIEVAIEARSANPDLTVELELEQRARWGEAYELQDVSVRTISESDWIRIAYRHAKVGTAIEYATVDRERRYVVTLFGTEASLEQTESILAASLRRVPSQMWPLIPAPRASRSVPVEVMQAFDSAVLIVAADFTDGRLRVREVGSGVIVAADGSVLASYDVLHDRGGRLYDVFAIGRFVSIERGAELTCVGAPARSKLQPEYNAALIKCDLDFDGRAMKPAATRKWATLAHAPGDLRVGQRLWSVGYSLGAALTPSQGELEGIGDPDLTTTLVISRAESGAPVVDDGGKLVGMTAVVKITGETETLQPGGRVRPLALANDLLAIAAVGWTPNDGRKDAEIMPPTLAGPTTGVRIATQIAHATTGEPIRDALVMVLSPGLAAASFDVNRLDDQVIAWGRSNTAGEVQLKQPVPPGTYSVVVVASGYAPLLGNAALVLARDTPEVFDPWGAIKLAPR